jgi:hypothetical protein
VDFSKLNAGVFGTTPIIMLFHWFPGVAPIWKSRSLLFEFVDNVTQLIGQLPRQMLHECLREFAVIPKRIFLGVPESAPHGFPDFSFTKVAEDRPRVVDLVGKGYQESFMVDQAEVFNACLSG